MHIKLSDRANESFPLEPYIQTPDKGFMSSGMEAGTLVIPSHPSQVGIPWLKGKPLLSFPSFIEWRLDMMLIG